MPETIPVELDALTSLLEGLQGSDHRGDVMDTIDCFLRRTGLFPDTWCEAHECWHIATVEDGDYDEPCEAWNDES